MKLYCLTGKCNDLFTGIKVSLALLDQSKSVFLVKVHQKSYCSTTFRQKKSFGERIVEEYKRAYNLVNEYAWVESIKNANR